MNMSLKHAGLTFLLSSLVALAQAQTAPPPVPAPPAAAGAPTAVSAPAPSTAAGPKIQFSEPIFDFGKIKSGEVVKHTYYFTNSGDQTLEVRNVQPSCGCTTAGEWSRKVEPGETGTIPLQFNSANFNGSVLKTIQVMSNAKDQPSVVLQLKGTIWKAIDVAPAFAVLNVPVDQPANPAVVRIVNNTEEPLTLGVPESNNKVFAAELRTNVPGKEYQLVVSTVPPLTAGNVQGQITIPTSSTAMPRVSVTAWANIQPAVVIMPPQVVLPAGPLPTPMNPAFTIQNNSTNLMRVSDIAFNLEGVEPEVKESVPGKTYTITLHFPQGFQLSPEKAVAVTGKTTVRQMPEFKVPVMQMPRQAQAPMPPPPTPVPHASAH